MDLHLHPPTSSRSAATKPRPTFPQLSPAPVFDYCPSADGVDTNLLIFFHGLGDTQIPFGNLGRKLNLPQTASMSIRAFERVPFLEEEAYQWWESFDITGALITNPNPSSSLAKLMAILDRLTSEELGWKAEDIHLFGFAQGGVVSPSLACNGLDLDRYRIHWRPSSPSLVHCSLCLPSLTHLVPQLLSYCGFVEVKIRSANGELVSNVDLILFNSSMDPGPPMNKCQ
ncbi:hypothetical protein Pst134EA_032925 [Puccinia striiformis f. sp. tritici]|uniref:uncharacterized protein n=1 Tax=Puccinia striiformis f. sp. tritici TaxID=168172 RepID=UPI00200829C1|nr:uncharacterized protein Pst134EA_032925 [Puccinia striiformis f. sp. tritici]KAH9441534.1 hypothetical protein Pst134EA_032925 [Puccinia striiformis f. sp. tritici]